MRTSGATTAAHYTNRSSTTPSEPPSAPRRISFPPKYTFNFGAELKISFQPFHQITWGM